MKDKLICSEKEIRLDQFLSKSKPEFSRSFFKNLIQNGLISVNERVQKKSGFSLKEGDKIQIEYPQHKKITDVDVDHLDIQLVFEDPEFLIINKGAGVLAHKPTSKSEVPTLVDWLLKKFKEIKNVGALDRPGIVHRLDMNTSGLMIIPKTNSAHKEFSDLFKERRIIKKYLAMVEGHPEQEGIIDFDIARHPTIRHKMTHVPKNKVNTKKYSHSRQSETEYDVLKYFDTAALVMVKPKTGRTHQIRVHFAGIGHPLIGDVIYGKQSKLIARHALHANALEFEFKGKSYSFEKEPPSDFKHLIETFS